MVITQLSHSNIRPFANWTTFDYLNTGLVQYSDVYCSELVVLVLNTISIYHSYSSSIRKKSSLKIVCKL